ncbi:MULTISPECIES: YcjF family protein [unclassified Shewanella]|uniref:YcjF family protein n=1 Tax=unclassified Shewanella TaxID=196818 RepID=UPI0021D8241A|nr:MULTISPECIES: YcjF family protein [unclassified Shewanella]MCU7997323.1 YcjF family protein [Shewanella sp. SM95]MCU8076485.1 YcjF family protein [Shewanella sp. SM29]
MTLKLSDNANEQASNSSANSFERSAEQSVEQSIEQQAIKQKPLKKQQLFDPEVVDLKPSKEELKGAKAFDPHTPVQEVAADIEELMDETLSAHPKMIDAKSVSPQLVKSRRWSWLARLAAVSLLLLVVVQTGLGLRDAWLESPWLFSFYGVVLGVVSAWALAGAVSEYRKLKRLKQVADTQETGARLAQSMQMGEADSFIDNIVCHYEDSQGLQQLRRSLKDEHNDAEKVLLFEDLVLTERDELAKKVVRRYAAESAVLLAASPLAVLDMAIILWRNQRMLRDVARCYGIDLGYWSRIKLIRSIIINIIYAGTSELVTDLGTQLLSVEMTGKLSARLAQGLGGGMLTARLGYQAMALCRPIVFREDQRPKLSKVHQELLIELKQFSGKLFTKEGRDALKGQFADVDDKVSRPAKDKSKE